MPQQQQQPQLQLVQRLTASEDILCSFILKNRMVYFYCGPNGETKLGDGYLTGSNTIRVRVNGTVELIACTSLDEAFAQCGYSIHMGNASVQVEYLGTFDVVP